MADLLTTAERVDLTNCDREPIHIPGSILPHGAMLVLDEESFEILQVAGDVEGLLRAGAGPLIGRNLADIVDDEKVERLRALAQSSDLIKPRHLLDPALSVRADRPVDASVHRCAGGLVLEFEEADPADPHAVDPLACVQEMLDGLETCDSLARMCEVAAARIRRITGYDRVMIYRFQQDESGWVFAEARKDGLEPFLDLHYPASDIPKQARALYLQSPLRQIPQIDYEPAKLTPPLNPRTGTPLDMSHATLRDVSPIHREYLRNMGVGASMSISIVIEGKLWGLVACHHYGPKHLPRHLQAICELFGAMFSLQLEAFIRATLLEARLTSRKVLHEIVSSLLDENDYGEGLFKQARRLLDYIDGGGLALRVSERGGGVAIRVNNGISVIGETPSDDQIGALSDWLTAKMDDGDGIFATDRLSEVWPPAADFAAVGSGLLALSISVEPRDFILWFRPEAVETVHWAGDPTKPVQVGEFGERLTPRKSFEAWSQEVRGRSTPWSVADGEAASDLRLSLLDIVLRRIDALARERERAMEQERLLIHELDHRVKNTLANIQALVSQTGRSASSLTEFTQGLERRIRSMSNAHGLLTESRWTGASIRDVVTQELEQYQGGRTIVIDGPETILTAKAALALSLAVHELATNAAKYGALSVAEGTVQVGWEALVPERVQLRWAEVGGPIVKPPARRGFGSTLIERALALETNGQASLRFEPQGVVCEIVLPATAVVRSEPPEPAPTLEDDVAPSAGEARDQANGERLRVLVVEDSALVLMTVEMMVEDMGWELIGPATRLDSAVELAQSATIDAALLDVNLDGEMSWPVAEMLKDRGVPFAFTTGYDGHALLPEHLAGSLIVAKPYSADRLAQAILHLTQPVRGEVERQG